ncbi:MAG: radical SAM protein [Desulfobacterales bacterium]|nr:radical SAM protein [Desulfobacterales bacterium]
MNTLTDINISTQLLNSFICKTEPYSIQEMNSQKMLRQHPFFNLWGVIEKNDKEQNYYEGNNEAKISVFFTPEIFRSFQNTFTDSLKELKNFDKSFISEKIKTLANFHELSNLRTIDILTVLGRKFYNEYLKQNKNHIKKMFPRQLTIILSYNCNLNCDFCFSNTLEKNDPGNIDYDFFFSILDWMEDKNFKNVCLFGGEPTIHPNFLIFSKILREKGYGVYFATNGLYNNEVAKGLHSIDFLKATFNIPCSNSFSNSNLKLLKKNLSSFPDHIQKSFRVTLSKGSRNFNLLETLINKYKPDNLSYALAFPANSKGNTYVNKDMVDHFLPEMKKINALAKSYTTPCVLAKPIPLCKFSTDDILSLLNSNKSGLCDIYHNNNSHLVTVSPSGRLYPCMSLPEKYNLNIKNRPSLNDISNANIDIIKKLIRKPVLNKCKNCNLYNSYICQGFCLAYFV